MGSCLGRCFPHSNNNSNGNWNFNLFTNRSVNADFSVLMEGEQEPRERRSNKKRSCTSRDIPLQCLDARALLAHTTSSTPASSVDLEWEHETLPISMIHDPSGSSWTALPEEFPTQFVNKRGPQNAVSAQESDSDWSRVSSTNSLEWDSVHNSYHPSPPASDIDTDTQMLLCEIERLTTQTLSETGFDLRS